MSGINLSLKLVKYKENPGLNARLPNYSVKMGFGLHVGWAIEVLINKLQIFYLYINKNNKKIFFFFFLFYKIYINIYLFKY